MTNNWSFTDVWNTALEKGKDRPPKERDNMWAGEIGGSYIDRYLKMKGTMPTNPPNARSRRKFEAGNLMEWLVKLILARAGILKEEQTWLSYNPEGKLAVTGKLDFIAGGSVDKMAGFQFVSDMGLPEFFARATEAIIESLPDEMSKRVLEVKSCSGFMWDAYDRNGASVRHEAQLYHYLLTSAVEEGSILYISRDDLRLQEFSLSRQTQRVRDFYMNDIDRMTHYIQKGVCPDKEPLIDFKEESGKFASNFKVAYSPYLKMLYGFENQASFDEVIKKKATGYDRVLGRLAEGKNMTDKNKIILESMEKDYKDLGPYIEIRKKAQKSDEIEE